MSKALALALVLVFLTASSTILAMPVSGTTAENTWVEKAPMHEARSGLGVAALNEKIYALGSKTEEYTPEVNNWTYKSSMPTPRINFAVASIDGKIYCIGGYNNSGTVTGVNEVYDPSNDTWTTMAPMPTARAWLDANAVDGKIYLIGGQNDSSMVQINEVYNIATDTWTTKSPIPIATGATASAVVDNKIFTIGADKNQIYDVKTDTWTLGASPLSPVWVGKAVATSGINAPQRIYVLSAITSELSKSDTTINQVYDPVNNSWVAGAFLPTNRYFFGFTVLNDLVYAIGGVTYNPIQNFPDDLIIGRYPSSTVYATVEQYLPFGYGAIPPVFTIASPINTNYSFNEILLNFSLNKPVNWTGYTLDGKDNITVTGNTTLTGLSNGLHNITVYAKDTFGNIGASETIKFTVASESFPVIPFAAIAVVVVIVATGLLVYHKKHKGSLVNKV
jgi:hypothetical protein